MRPILMAFFIACIIGVMSFLAYTTAEIMEKVVEMNSKTQRVMEEYQ